MPPVFLNALTVGLVALIPKALTDAYDYFFNGEEIQVKKKADKTKWSNAHIVTAKREYQLYLTDKAIYPTQQDLVDTLNQMCGTNKSVAQVMRICRSDS